MKIKPDKLPDVGERAALLTALRNTKMATSAHAYVRGNTVRFYNWLEELKPDTLPEGPPVWICGDCHLGNLGPVANAEGDVDIQIRDFDQTVIGNPAHDLIRLGLSLASLARGSDLPGVITSRMLEQMIEGYIRAFDASSDIDAGKKPDSVHVVMKQAMQRSWKHLAKERMQGAAVHIPLGKRFWPVSQEEQNAIRTLFETEGVRRLATSLKHRDDDAAIEVLDMAYWAKGCSSLGRLRYAVLLDVDSGSTKGRDLCLIDIKEAVKPAAPRYQDQRMPRDNGERVVAGARQLSPYLGERMLPGRLLDTAVFLRELLPQDLKVEIDELTEQEAMRTAHYLAAVVGKAHARQFENADKQRWQAELRRNRSKTLDAPSWLWSSVVDLLASHESGYLEHCRRYSISKAA